MSALVVFDPETSAVSSLVAEAKELALAGTALINRVETAEQNAAAAAAVAEVSALKSQIERAHRDAKLPFLRRCQLLDDLKKTLLKELLAEELRVNMLCGEYRMAQEEKVREAQRERQRELDRIENERLENERRIRAEAERVEAERLAEQRRIEQEAAAARSKQAQAEAKAKLAEIERQRAEDAAKAESERKQREALAIQEREALAPIKTAEKVAGQTVKIRRDYEVTDIWALARSNPALVEITPRRAEILEMINAHGMHKIPGLNIFEEAKVSSRANGRKAIDV